MKQPLGKLTEFIFITLNAKNIAIIGGGGKSSLLKLLALNASLFSRAEALENEKIFCYTTCKIARSEIDFATAVFDSSKPFGLLKKIVCCEESNHVGNTTEIIAIYSQKTGDVRHIRAPLFNFLLDSNTSAIKDHFNNVKEVSGCLYEQSFFQVLIEYLNTGVDQAEQRRKMNPIAIVEADGARRCSLKAHKPGYLGDPVIPFNTDLVVAVVGVDVFSKNLAEDYVFRSELFSEITDLKLGESITIEAVVKILTNKESGYFSTLTESSKTKKMIVFNKIDCIEIEQTRIEFMESVKNTFFKIVGAEYADKYFIVFASIYEDHCYM